MFRKTSSNVLLMTRSNKLQVEELQKSLSLKSQELEAKNALANQKLKQMVRDLFQLLLPYIKTFFILH